MRYESKEMEAHAMLETARRMCVAARTAPKGRGIDNIVTLVLSGEEKEQLAQKMEAIVVRDFAGDPEHFFMRDVKNLRNSPLVVLIGVKRAYTGLAHCSMCGFEDCGACRKAGGRCAFNTIDLGIALGSAVATAAADRVDNRIMYSIGRAANEMGYAEAEDDVIWQAIPLSVTSKSPYFDR